MKASHIVWVALGAVALLFGWYWLDKRKATARLTAPNGAAGPKPGASTNVASQAIASAPAIINALGGLFGGKGDGLN